MRITDCIMMAFTNLRKRKFRTFLNAFAISIGTMLIITMVSLGTGVQRLLLDTFKENSGLSIVTIDPSKYKAESDVNNKSTDEEKDPYDELLPETKPITKSDIQKIRSEDKVNDILVYREQMIKGVRYNNNIAYRPIFNFIDTEYSLYLKSKVEELKLNKKEQSTQFLLNGKEIKKGDKGKVLISDEFAKRLKVENVNSLIDKDIYFILDKSELKDENKEEFKLTVVGIIDKKISGSDIISDISTIDIFNEFLLRNINYEKEGPTAVEVEVKEPTYVKQVSDNIRESLGFNTSTYEDIVVSVSKTFLVIKVILAILGTIVLFVASLGTINTMIMSIYERTKVIGIMKAVGASRKDIRLMFIIESGIIGFIGGVIGSLFALSNQSIIKLIITEYLKKQNIGDLSVISNLSGSLIKLCLGSITFAVIISIIAGLIPASRAAKLNPIDCLRYE